MLPRPQRSDYTSLPTLSRCKDLARHYEILRYSLLDFMKCLHRTHMKAENRHLVVDMAFGVTSYRSLLAQ